MKKCIYKISNHDLVNLINLGHNVLSADFMVLNVPKFELIPKDALIEQINYLWDYDCFGLLVSHKSFPEVPEGTKIPIYPETIVFRKQTLLIRDTKYNVQS